MSKKHVSELIGFFGGSQTATAAALGVRQSTVAGWLSGAHGVSAISALKAEAATGGKVLAVDLCPGLNLEKTA